MAPTTAARSFDLVTLMHTVAGTSFGVFLGLLVASRLVSDWRLEFVGWLAFASSLGSGYAARYLSIRFKRRHGLYATTPPPGVDPTV